MVKCLIRFIILLLGFFCIYSQGNKLTRVAKYFEINFLNIGRLQTILQIIDIKKIGNFFNQNESNKTLTPFQILIFYNET